MSKINRKEIRQRVHARIRKKVAGTTERPRLAVHYSNQHIYVQVIDDDAGVTLASASTLDSAIKAVEGSKSDLARAVGKLAAERALAKGITKLVFDRNGFRYTGRIAAVSEAAHEMGLLSKDGHTGASEE